MKDRIEDSKDVFLLVDDSVQDKRYPASLRWCERNTAAMGIACVTFPRRR